VVVFLDSKPLPVLGAADQTPFTSLCKTSALQALTGGEQPATYLLSVGGKCANATLVPSNGSFKLELTPGAALAPQGAAGGPQYDRTCPAGQVVTGFSAFEDGLGLSGLTLKCSPLSVDPDTLAVKIGAATSLTLIGGMGTGPLGDALCPASYVAVGILGQLYLSDDTIVGLGLQCARPTVQ